jgi:hypothetical protein
MRGSSSDVTAFSGAAALVSLLQEGARCKPLISTFWEAGISPFAHIIRIPYLRPGSLLLRSDHGMSLTQWPRALNNIF